MRPRDRADIRFIEIKSDDDDERILDNLNENWSLWLTVHGTKYPRYVMRQEELKDEKVDELFYFLLFQPKPN